MFYAYPVVWVNSYFHISVAERVVKLMRVVSIVVLSSVILKVIVIIPFVLYRLKDSKLVHVVDNLL